MSLYLKVCIVLPFSAEKVVHIAIAFESVGDGSGKPVDAESVGGNYIDVASPIASGYSKGLFCTLNPYLISGHDSPVAFFLGVSSNKSVDGPKFVADILVVYVASVGDSYIGFVVFFGFDVFDKEWAKYV